jgi:hypothetical protein
MKWSEALHSYNSKTSQPGRGTSRLALVNFLRLGIFCQPVKVKLAICSSYRTSLRIFLSRL